ncbi:putative transposase [Burkholderia pseudomallei]|uniref:Transposase n=1 Tax=Burkholderia pseudomallei TaxID=28450 RepID=A0AA40JJ16_BURPE|nr:hypothetical protein [Burkholderia pseudomallei]KGD54892.1 putative transposase [Burkholderia pseudomallei]KGW74897.1 putative transposase [Burkholderia pseudomallei MSHR2990]KGX17109.1 putative transposase [Burkholderia pseudomallei]
MIETIRQGLKEEGVTVSISKLCRWFEVPRRRMYYRPVKFEHEGVCDSQTSFHFLEDRFFGASEPVAPIGDTGSDARR